MNRLNALLAKGINPTVIHDVIEQIEGMDEEEAYQRTQGADR